MKAESNRDNEIMVSITQEEHTRLNNLDCSQELEALHDALRLYGEENTEMKEAIYALRDCNDAGERYNSPTANAEQCLANVFLLADKYDPRTQIESERK